MSLPVKRPLLVTAFRRMVSMTLVASLALAGCVSHGGTEPSSGGDASAATTPQQSSRSDGASVAPAKRTVVVESTVPVGAAVRWLRATPDGIWASVTDAVLKIDPVTGEIADRIDVPTTADTWFWSFEVAYGSLWVSYHFTDHSARLLRLDLATHAQVADILVFDPARGGGAGGVVAAFDSIWVAMYHAGAVARIDPETNEVRDWIHLGLPGVGGPWYLGVGADAIWATRDQGAGGSGAIVRIDPGSREVAAMAPVSTLAIPCGPWAVSGDQVWAGSCEFVPALTRVDPSDGSEIVTMRLDGAPGTPLVVGDRIWVPIVRESGASSLVAIDGESNTVVEELSVAGGFLRLPNYVAPAIVGFGSAWISTADDTIVRIALDELVSAS